MISFSEVLRQSQLLIRNKSGLVLDFKDVNIWMCVFTHPPLPLPLGGDVLPLKVGSRPPPPRHLWNVCTFSPFMWLYCSFSPSYKSQTWGGGLLRFQKRAPPLSNNQSQAGWQRSVNPPRHVAAQPPELIITSQPPAFPVHLIPVHTTPDQTSLVRPSSVYLSSAHSNQIQFSPD